MKAISSGLNRYYHAMQRRFSDVLWFGDEACREIALTFDDGPHPRDTPRVLETLAKYEVRATFFLVGRNIELHSSLVQQIHHHGHQIGIHCYRHIPFPLENSSTLRRQLVHTKNIIAEICGISPENITHIRPPYGMFTAQTISLLTKWQYRPVMWNNIPPHWMQPISWTVKQIFDQTVPGSVIVLHDGHGHGSKAAHIVDLIIPELKKQGFNFVTIENMKRNQNNAK